MTYTEQIIAISTQLEIMLAVYLHIRRVGWHWFINH